MTITGMRGLTDSLTDRHFSLYNLEQPLGTTMMMMMMMMMMIIMMMMIMMTIRIIMVIIQIMMMMMRKIKTFVIDFKM